MTDFRPELVIIRGLPGSGKSTRAREEFPAHLHYEPDHYFRDTAGQYRFDMQLWGQALHWAWTMSDFALARGEDVVVTDVFPRAKDLENYRVLARAHGATLRIITQVEEYGSVHRVPITAIEEMRQQFEWGLDTWEGP